MFQTTPTFAICFQIGELEFESFLSVLVENYCKPFEFFIKHLHKNFELRVVLVLQVLIGKTHPSIFQLSLYKLEQIGVVLEDFGVVDEPLLDHLGSELELELFLEVFRDCPT